MHVRFTRRAFLKMKYFIEECPAEISGLGKIREVNALMKVEVEDESYWDKISSSIGFRTYKPKYKKVKKMVRMLEVYDIQLLPQEVTSAHASIASEDLAKFLHERMKAKDRVQDYKLWWHSHAEMGVFFSGTDENTIDESTEFPYLLSIVGNHAGDFKARLDFYQPIRATVDDLDLDLAFAKAEDRKLRALCRKEIAKKVKITGYFTPIKVKGKKKDEEEYYIEPYKREEDPFHRQIPAPLFGDLPSRRGASLWPNPRDIRVPALPMTGQFEPRHNLEHREYFERLAYGMSRKQRKKLRKRLRKIGMIPLEDSDHLPF